MNVCSVIPEPSKAARPGAVLGEIAVGSTAATPPSAHRGSLRSVIIPVFNGAETIAGVVADLLALTAVPVSEIILVNDGSSDDSEQVCRRLAAQHPEHITFVQLRGNFGEHAAVTAGFRYCRGRYAAVVDDDGQHPAEEVARLFLAAEQGEYDVVYGRFVARRHPLYRRCLSRLHNLVACQMLAKPRGLYLSSFKVVSRNVARQIAAYDGPFPYVDGVILRTPCKLGQVDVAHRTRQGGRSGYTTARLLRLWWLIFRGWSTTSFCRALLLGAAAVVAAVSFWLGSALRTIDGGVSYPQLAVVVGFFAVAAFVGWGWLTDGFGPRAPSRRRPPFHIQYVLREAASHA